MYLSFWGKTDRQEDGLWHPAAYHMLDVAAVAENLLATRLEWHATDPDGILVNFFTPVTPGAIKKFER
ncbi:MAG: hypothetical protein JOZ40_12090 [Methylobacteriaceae bacterium]|nr:hypothetical protein [Methylobacteriaceae bacterium]